MYKGETYDLNIGDKQFIMPKIGDDETLIKNHLAGGLLALRGMPKYGAIGSPEVKRIRKIWDAIIKAKASNPNKQRIEVVLNNRVVKMKPLLMAGSNTVLIKE